MTNDYTVKPGVDFVKNIASGSFKNLSVNQATSFAANGYSAYAIGAGIAGASNGEDGAFAGGLAKAMVANGLQMKGALAYDSLKGFIKSDYTFKGLGEMVKFSKYSNAYRPIPGEV